MREVSGVGLYTNSFDWNKTSTSGLLLNLSYQHDQVISVSINDHEDIIFHNITDELDITDYLNDGENTITIKTASTLFNRAKVENEAWDGTQKHPGSQASIQAYGLTSVSLSPYTQAQFSLISTGGGSGSGGSSGSSGGSTSSSSVSGSWRRDEIGWWFQYFGGGYPAGKWEYIAGKWYYFNESGYAHTGWLLQDGNWYYLDLIQCDMQTGWHKEADDGYWYYLGSDGAMRTDWQLVNGIYYYLNPSIGQETAYEFDSSTNKWTYSGRNVKPLGAMYESEETPDGNRIDENGAWVGE